MVASSAIINPNTALQLREGRVSDCAVLAELINESAEGAVDYLFADLNAPIESMTLLLEQEVYYSYANTIIAEIKNEVVGMALCFPADGLIIGEKMKENYSEEKLQYVRFFVDNKIADSWHLDALCVRSEFRNRGIGAALLAAVKDKAVQYNFASASVFVFGSNDAAIRFYQRYGFVQRTDINTQGQEFLRDKKFLRLMELNF